MSILAKRKKSIYPYFHKRHDFETALIVEEGIKLQEKAGTEFAEAYLRFRGIKPDVISRVLNDPVRRRVALDEEPEFDQ